MTNSARRPSRSTRRAGLAASAHPRSSRGQALRGPRWRHADRALLQPALRTLRVGIGTNRDRTGPLFDILLSAAAIGEHDRLWPSSLLSETQAVIHFVSSALPCASRHIETAITGRRRFTISSSPVLVDGGAMLAESNKEPPSSVRIGRRRWTGRCADRSAVRRSSL